MSNTAPSPLNAWLREVALCDDRYMPQDRTLWHYTDLCGMKGIVATDSLWLTGHRWLNDSSEIDYGLAIGKSVLESMAAETDSEELRSLLSWFNGGSFKNAIDERGVFVGCLASDGDSLLHWFGYAKEGVAIGITPPGHPDSLVRTSSIGSSELGSLARVRYEPEEQRSLFESLFTAIIDASDADQGYKGLKYLRQAILGVRFAASICKNPGFRTELEWRIVYTPSLEGEPGYTADQPQEKPRRTPYGRAQYVELPLPKAVGVDHEKIPIKTVRLSPMGTRQDQEDRRQKANEVLRCLGAEEIKLEPSEIPVRPPTASKSSEDSARK